MGDGLAIVSSLFSFDTGKSVRGLLFAWPQSEQVTDRVDQIGAVHGVEMEIGDAVVDQIEHLFGSDRGGDQFASRRIIVEAVETCRQPMRDRSAGTRGETPGLLEILHRQNAGHDRDVRCLRRARGRDSGSKDCSRKRIG